MQIKILNVKKIRSLTFDLPEPGVWIITGENGAGKTCLLAAIFRIKAPHAFQKYYRTSLLESRLDSYEGASVSYTIDDQHVSYSYGGERWRATPRSNSRLLATFPYPTIEYIDVNASRIEPFANEIFTRRVQSATVEICSFLEYVLNDNKWASLKFVNTQRGRGNAAYLIPYMKNNRIFYYSEKSFSLGELCVFKLAKKIDAVPQNSLLIIDEIEMALHPQAQVRLVEKISEIAAVKQLTVIFSTHSATIIKSIDKKQLIYLKDTGSGNITPIKSAYPAQILGDVAFEDELSADFIFFVEDKQAKILLEQMIGKYFSLGRNDRNYQPLYKIVPIGGYPQVIEMLNNSSSIFPPYIKKFAFLDKDVEVTLATARRERNQSIINLFHNPTNIRYLPCTPELGFIEMIEDAANNQLLVAISQSFPGVAIHLERIIRNRTYLTFAGAPRDCAKKKMSHIVEKIAQQTQMDETQIRRQLYSSYVNFFNSQAPAALRQLFGPIFR